MILASKERSAGSTLSTSLSSMLTYNTDRTSQVASTPDLHLTSEHHVSVEISRLQVPGQQKVRTNDANPDLETHYVLVVHGTFVKSNEPGKVTWHHPDPTGEHNNFCGRLAALLAEGPLGSESVWRALPGAKAPSEVTYPFHWDASNTDQGRQQGIPILMNSGPQDSLHTGKCLGAARGVLPWQFAVGADCENWVEQEF